MPLSHIALLPEAIEYHPYSHLYGGHEELSYTFVQDYDCQNSWNVDVHSEGFSKLEYGLNQTIQLSKEYWRTSFDDRRESDLTVDSNMMTPLPHQTSPPLQTPRIIRRPRHEPLEAHLDLSSLFKSDATSSPSHKRIALQEENPSAKDRSNLSAFDQFVPFAANHDPRQSHTNEPDSKWDSDSDSGSSSASQSLTTNSDDDADVPKLALARTCVSDKSRSCPIPLSLGCIKTSSSSREDITIRESRHWPTYVSTSQEDAERSPSVDPIITSAAVNYEAHSRTSVRCLSWLSQVPEYPDCEMAIEHSLHARIPPTRLPASTSPPPAPAPAPKILSGLAITITSPTSSTYTSSDDASVRVNTPFPCSSDIERGRPCHLWPGLGPGFELGPSPEIQNQGGYEHTPLEALFDWDSRHSTSLSDETSRYRIDSHTTSAEEETSPRPELFNYKPSQIRAVRVHALRRLSVATQGPADITLSRSHFDNHDRATPRKQSKSMRTGFEALRDLLGRIRSASMSTP